MKRSYRAGSGLIVLAGVSLFAVISPVSADRLTSPSYTIDTSVAAPFGGQTGSANYKLVTGGGEAINGMPVSGSYKMGAGYVAQLEQSIQLSLGQSTIALGNITPNISNTGTLAATVTTDAPGYSLSINQNANLTSGANSIPAINSGTIAAPISWVEGTTKGLGFTITSGPSLPAKWGSTGAYKYAAIPSSITSLHTRTGYTGGVNETTTLQPRVDIVPNQAVGSYSNTVTLTATLIP